MIQYQHSRPSEYADDPGTYAVQIKDPKDIKAIADTFYSGFPNAEITLGIGRARLHPKDRFEKAKGRLVATQNIEFQSATVIDMEVNKKRIKIFFETKDYYVTISVSRDKNNPILRGINAKETISKVKPNLKSDFYCGVW